jgi:DNA-binding response OmpR family regulator
MQGNPKSILVIDDDQELVRAAHMRLRSAGYETREARDGEEGIQEANSRHPDAVLLDIRMPRKDGLAVLGELKRSA